MALKSVETATHGHDRRLATLVALALGALTLLAYWGVWRNEFINYDDTSYVYQNQHVIHGITWPTIVWAFTHSHVSNWHPLTWISHALDCQLYGLRPAGHHVTNLILHAANVVLLFFTLRLLTGAIWRSAFVAALFALHPLHVESVAWIAERKDVLSGFFFMLTLLAYGKYVKSLESKARSPESKIFYVLALGAFALGLMSKPMLVTLPFVLLLLDYWPLRRLKTVPSTTWQSIFLRRSLEKIPFFLLSAGSCVITIIVQNDAMAETTAVPISVRFSNAALAYVRYLSQTLWPSDLAIFYPHPIQVLGAQTLVATIFLIGVTVAAIWFARRQPCLPMGWFWFLGMLVPVIGLIQVGAQAHADRYTYLPLIGIFILFTWTVAASKIAQGRFKWLFAGGAVALLAVLGLTANRQVQQWRSSRTIYEHAIQVTPDNYLALGGLAVLDLREGNSARAMTNLTRALAFAENYYAGDTIKYYMGVALQVQGKGLEALPYLLECRVVYDQMPDRNYRLGLSLIEANRLAEAESCLQQALNAKPNDLEYQLGMAVLFQKKGQTTKAEQMIREVIATDPKSAQAHRTYADFLMLLNRLAEAETHYAQAVELQPTATTHRLVYASALRQVGKINEAIAQLEAALKQEPGNFGLHFELAELMSQQGHIDNAVAHYGKAIEADPNSVTALNNLAWLLATDADARIRNGPRAVELAERACQLTGWKTAVLMGTLAAAHAESGDFTKAVAMAERARGQAVADKLEGVIKKNDELLQLYRASKPYRETKQVSPH